MLFHFGGADSYIPAEQVDAIRDAVADRDGFTVNVEPAAGHAFDNHESDMFYDAAAAASAWEQTTAFLNCHLPVG
jgi:carboxymethylenebutenolidase